MTSVQSPYLINHEHGKHLMALCAQKAPRLHQDLMKDWAAAEIMGQHTDRPAPRTFDALAFDRISLHINRVGYTWCRLESHTPQPDAIRVCVPTKNKSPLFGLDEYGHPYTYTGHREDPEAVQLLDAYLQAVEHQNTKDA